MAEMRYRRLGDSGLMVSVVGVGCNNFGFRIDADQTREVVTAALDAGINLFDTADVYGGQGKSEELLGAALRGRRDEAVIATKFGMDMAGANGPDWGARGARRYVVRAVEASLRRLGTDWIDLYQLHTPDPGTPIEETLAALDELVRAGKVRYLGHSNFAGWQVADAAWLARTGRLTPFVSAQNHYNLLHREPVESELIPACQRFGVGLLPYFPLASGLLTGKYRRGADAPAGTRLAADRFASRLAAAPWDIVEGLTSFAEQRSLSLLQVAIGGLAAQPAVASVIAGATSAEQVHANVAAGAWEPTEAELAELRTITQP
ncbi:aldo/keto reductase [Natronosporangium hydrolyticum]|uniref:Aldo/keto reductase n=1 Tax=Natronosporangium hydrolyticum TaxID=2811111 RepID=A0A895YDU9_9ACTN|nr:aldo/keto reductase [Natronosporangium hydrolyticum]QSB14355.1 aldo/keto reductase [Natronosporangium hydrolyticum]